MKTILQIFSTHLLLLFLLLGLLCTPFLFFNYEAMDELLDSCKNQWQNLAYWVPGSAIPGN